MKLTLLSSLTSFIITFAAIPSIIRLAEIKNLFDEPGHRKTHQRSVPTLGGLAIFAGFIFALTFWSSQREIVELQYIISATLILFFMGMKDDLFDLVAYKKFIGQLAASFILVHWGGIRITSFFGLFGLNDLGLIQSYSFSVFTIIVITNSINLIDGIDALAGSIGVLVSIVFGSWFVNMEQWQYVVLASSLGGSLLAFLFYNRTPARIFMGDTGSLMVGAILSILAIKFIEMNRVLPLESPNKIRGVPVFTIAVLIVPLYDTLRVFAIRLLQGRSPFSSDRNHVHHLLIDVGLSHMQAVGLLIAFNVAIIATAFSLQGTRSEIVLCLMLGLCLTATYGLAMFRNRLIKRGRVVNSFSLRTKEH